MAESLAVAITVLYLAVGLAAGFQIARILYNRHNVCSFHFAFLMMVFLWSSLRVVFFGVSARMTTWITLWIFWCPVDLQFSTFSLLVVYYAYLLYKPVWSRRRRSFVIAYCVVNALMYIVTIAYITVGCETGSCDEDDPHLTRVHHLYMGAQFLLLTLVYGYYGYKLSSVSEAPVEIASHTPGPYRYSPYLSSAGGGGPRFSWLSSYALVLITLFAWVVFTSRCVYYFLAAFKVFRFSIARDTNGMRSIGPATFVLLMVWEIVPTCLVLIYFRSIPRNQYRSQLASREGWCCGLCSSADENADQPEPPMWSGSVNQAQANSRSRGGSSGGGSNDSPFSSPWMSPAWPRGNSRVGAGGRFGAPMLSNADMEEGFDTTFASLPETMGENPQLLMAQREQYAVAPESAAPHGTSPLYYQAWPQ